MPEAGWEFTFVVDGVDLMNDDVGDVLFEATGGDIDLSTRDGVSYASFTRSGEFFQHEVLDAISMIENTGVGAVVLRMQTDELLSVSEIARRTSRTPESIRLLITGERGPANFPAAETRPGARNRLWQWNAIVEWFQTYDPDAVAGYLASVPDPEFVRSLNAALTLRRHLSKVTSPEVRRRVRQLVTSS